MVRSVSMARFSTDMSAAMSQQLVPWRDALFLPLRWDVEVEEDPPLPYRLMLSIAVEDGKPILDSVEFRRRDGAGPVTHRTMRMAKVGEYVQQACHLMALTQTLTEGSVSYEPAHSLGDEFDVYPEGGGGRQAHISEAHKRDVAEVYNSAVQSGSRTPRKAVQEDPRWRPVPTQTAARWIRLARDAGFIAEAKEQS